MNQKFMSTHSDNVREDLTSFSLPLTLASSKCVVTNFWFQPHID